MKKQNQTVYCGVFAALTAVLAQIALPMPSGIPITLQTFAVALYGYLFPPALALRTTLVYLACGAVGLPVFGLMRGGIAVLLGPTGGFLWGFLFYSVFCTLPLQSKLLRLICGIGGLLLCHLAGAVQYCILGEIPPLSVLLTLTLPLFPKDLILLIGALLLSAPCKKALERSAGKLPF